MNPPLVPVPSGASPSSPSSSSSGAAKSRAAKRWSDSKVMRATLIGSAVGVALVYVATHMQGIVGGIEPLFAATGLALLVATARDWTFGVKALLVVVVLEGAVRKWFMPSVTELVYFYKDVLMLVTLFGYFKARGKTPLVIKRYIKPVSLLLVVFTVYGIASLGLPGGSHPLIGILGLKAYCLYVPLAFLTPRAFQSKEELLRFLKWYLLLVLPVAAIGMLQFVESDPRSTLNRYAIGEETSGRAANIATFNSAADVYYVRITSTFSYITGLSVYLPVMFGLLLALTSLHAKQHLKRGIKILYYAAMGATVVLSLMTGSRGAVLAVIVVAVVFYFFTARRNALKRLQQVAVIGVILYVALTTMFPQAYDAFYNRTFGTEDRMNEGWERMLSVFDLPMEEASYAGLLGYGIGLTQNSVPALMKRLGMPEEESPIPIPYEGEPGRVMLELGVAGFSLYTLLRLALLLTVFRMCLLIRDPEAKMLAFAAAAALVLPLISGGAVTTHTLNVYQWFLVGCVMTLLNAERLQASVARPTPRLALRAAPAAP